MKIFWKRAGLVLVVIVLGVPSALYIGFRDVWESFMDMWTAPDEWTFL